MKIEKIKWRIFEPKEVHEFPCGVCAKKIGTNFISQDDFCLVVCEDDACQILAKEIITNMISNKK